MQLPWQRDEGTREGGTTAAPETVPPRARRWRRLRGAIAPTAAVVPAPGDAVPATASDAPARAADAPRAPGFVAVAIARILIAIDFALGGRR